METETIMKIANHEYYVSLEVAKLLKEAGFDWKCRGIYVLDSENDPEYVFSTSNFTNTSKEIEGYIRLSAPTLEVAQRWLRETQKYQVAILPNGLKGYATLCFLHKEPITQPFRHYSTYEEALEVGIKRTLEIILENRE